MNKTIFIICMLISCLSMINAEIIFDENFTGQELLQEAQFPNANRQPVNNGNGTITFNTGNADFEIFLQLDLFGAGVVDANETVTVNASFNVSEVSNDSELIAVLTDGTNLVGFMRSDNGIGQFFSIQGTDGGDVLQNRVQQADNTAAFNDVFDVDFTLNPNDTQFIADMSGTSSTNKTAINALDASQGLSLLLIGQQAAEAYQVNSIAATVDATLINNEVPEPSTYLLCALLGLFGFFRFRKNAKTA